MAKYRKIPHVVEAMQMPEPFTVDLAGQVWRGEAGAWLVTLPEGDMYPCADSVFQKTFVAVEEEALSLHGESFVDEIQFLRSLSRRLLNLEGYELGDANDVHRLRDLATKLETL